ncbi:MAG: Rpn family recombination-promoting nuclease/putative transposase [Clostridia bacterium]|nr:Rpn family recombination-promoting nuclease/putative transposase [Clostridia bacterium]
MAEKDITTKTVESYNDVFADIVNGFLFNGEKVILPDELTPADTYSQYKADGKIRKQERDVSKYWHNADIKLAFIGIENQSVPDKFMPIRIFSYDGAAYRNQMNINIAESSDKPESKNFYPVITLVLYFGQDEWTYGKSLHDCFDIPDRLQPFVNNYKMNFYSMKDITSEEIERFDSDFRIIAEFFMNMNKKDNELSFSDQKLEHPQETLDLINVFSGDNRFMSAYNEMLTENNEGGVSMCELIDRIEARGVAKGVEKGKAEGRAEGKAEGKAEGRSEIVRSLIEIGRSIKEIAEFFKTDEEEIKRLLSHG